MSIWAKKRLIALHQYMHTKSPTSCLFSNSALADFLPSELNIADRGNLIPRSNKCANCHPDDFSVLWIMVCRNKRRGKKKEKQVNKKAEGNNLQNTTAHKPQRHLTLAFFKASQPFCSSESCLNTFKWDVFLFVCFFCRGASRDYTVGSEKDFSWTGGFRRKSTSKECWWIDDYRCVSIKLGANLKQSW